MAEADFSWLSNQVCYWHKESCWFQNLDPTAGDWQTGINSSSSCSFSFSSTFKCFVPSRVRSSKSLLPYQLFWALRRDPSTTTTFPAEKKGLPSIVASVHKQNQRKYAMELNCKWVAASFHFEEEFKRAARSVSFSRISLVHCPDCNIDCRKKNHLNWIRIQYNSQDVI